MKFKVFLVLLLFLLINVDYVYTQVNGTGKCKSSVKGGKYQKSEIAHWQNEPKKFSGNVLIKPQNVNREFLIKLAKRLKAEYCMAEYFTVNIYDDSDSMNFGWEIYNQSENKIIRHRATYTFDITAGINEIEYSTKKGNPTNENKIDLNSEMQSID